MRFSHIAIVYFLMGSIVFATGVVPASNFQDNPGSVFVDVGGDDVDVNETSVGGAGDGGDGILDDLIKPIENTLDTIAGGTLVAVWGAITAISQFYAWPVTTANYIGAPVVVKLIAGTLVASFTFGVLRVIKASI